MKKVNIMLLMRLTSRLKFNKINNLQFSDISAWVPDSLRGEAFKFSGKIKKVYIIHNKPITDYFKICLFLGLRRRRRRFLTLVKGKVLRKAKTRLYGPLIALFWVFRFKCLIADFLYRDPVDCFDLKLGG